MPIGQAVVQHVMSHLPPTASQSRSRKIPQRPRKATSAVTSRHTTSVPLKKRQEEFRDEGLEAKPGCRDASLLWCSFCRDDVSNKASSIKQHLRSGKHNDCKSAQGMAASRKQALISNLIADARAPSALPNRTLEPEAHLSRIQVVSSFLAAGLPLNMVPSLAHLFAGYRMTVPSQLSAYITYIHQLELQAIKKSIANEDVLVIFDGTTRLGEVLAVVLRFVTADLQVHQLLVSVRTYERAMKADGLAAALASVLIDQLAIPTARVFGIVHDRAAVNSKAVNSLRTILFKQTLDLACLSHTLNNCGEQLQAPLLNAFFLDWTGAFSFSAVVAGEWRSLAGTSMPTHSRTRWWSAFELLHYLFKNWTTVNAFLAVPDVKSAHLDRVRQMRANVQDWRLLHIQLAAFVDFGLPFTQATYALEGDGPLLFVAHEWLQQVQAIATASDDVLRATVLLNAQQTVAAHIAELVDLPEHTPADRVRNANARHMYQQEPLHVVHPANAYFVSHFIGPDLPVDLMNQVALIRLAKLVDPRHFPAILQASAVEAQLRELHKLIPAWLPATELPELLRESPGYADLAASEPPQVEAPNYGQQILLSAAVERVFSLLSRMYDDSRASSLMDQIELSLMLAYNKRNVTL